MKLSLGASKEDRAVQLAADTRMVRLGSAGWYIQRLAAQLDRAMDRDLAPHGLNLQGFAILMNVIEHRGLTQSQIAGRFSAPAYAISRALDALEDAGYVARLEDPASRRSKRIEATDKGMALALTLFETVNRVNGALLAGLDLRDRAQMMSLLRTTLESHALGENAAQPNGECPSVQAR
jgi:DNA-binding MarR family transcriptional regulator